MIRAHAEGVIEILEEMDRITHALDLDRNDLGKTLLDIATGQILVNMDAEADPDGTPWAPLSESYLTWKMDVAPQAPIGVLYGRMKTWEQIAGERSIGADSAAMSYGTDPLAQVEAIKFTFGGAVTGTNQSPRPFYGLTQGAIAQANALLEVTFDAAW